MAQEKRKEGLASNELTVSFGMSDPAASDPNVAGPSRDHVFTSVIALGTDDCDCGCTTPGR